MLASAKSVVDLVVVEENLLQLRTQVHVKCLEDANLVLPKV